MTTRKALTGVTAFLAITTILGGVGILLDRLGLDDADLDGSPFSSYLLPGLALALLVGGSAVAATWLLIRRDPAAPFAAAAAGAAMMIFELVQMVYIPFHILQIVYLLIGAITFALAVRVWSTTHAVTS